MKKVLNILLVSILITFCFNFGGCKKNDFPIKESLNINGDTYIISFFDDFNGTSLDVNKWEFCPEMNRQDVGGKWSNDMATVNGKGNLVISAGINKNGVPISGAIRTKGKFEQAQGYFEIKCKLQSQPGFWSAFWLMCEEMYDGNALVDNSAIDGCEIDIFEAFDVEDGQICHALHWDGYNDDEHKKTAKIVNTNCYDEKFHTFSLLWTETEYIFYIDDVETYRLNSSNAEFPGISAAPSYLKITTEFGAWAGEYNPNLLPDSLIVDYVAVYNKNVI